MMTFFVTSRGSGKGGDLRLNQNDPDGLAGADALCKTLATAVSAELGAKNWKAYLSTSTVDARDRIGRGPWRNAKGQVIADSLAELHMARNPKLIMGNTNNTKAMFLDEKGNVVGGVGNNPNDHDVLTGSTAMGTKVPNARARTCNDWTLGETRAGVNAQLGHSDQARPNTPVDPGTWNSVHVSSGCAPGRGDGSVGRGGGRGSFYCFVAN
jgi:hypothetical protein